MLVKPRNNFPMNQYKKKSTKFGSYCKWFHSIRNSIYTFFSLLFYIVILLISNDFFQISVHILQYILTLWIFILPYRCRLMIALIFPESRRTVRIWHVAIGYICGHCESSPMKFLSCNILKKTTLKHWRRWIYTLYINCMYHFDTRPI